MKNLPMGSYYDKNARGVNFSLFSASASKVELCLLVDETIQSFLVNEKNGYIWSLWLNEAQVGTRYCYRIDDHPELLLDPYAKAVELLGGQLWGIVIDEQYDWQEDVAPTIPWGNTVIYEAHVKGLTKLHPEIPIELRGSYAGLSHPIMLDYLTQLGITTIELLPIQFHLDEPRLQQLGLHNYWGYNVIAPFAVESKYWSKTVNTTPLSEFNDMVKALHSAGIEVILDVVFNHTAELDEQGPILSLKGIDSLNYYWYNCEYNGQHELSNWTGCGNTLKLTQTNVIQWVMDCLRYWVINCHIDGFRFDLATILGRIPEFSPESPLIIAMQQDPILKKCKLIAEPWDIGDNGYQLGNFPYPFAEWNDKYRDDMRRFWLYGNLSRGDFAQRFAASSGLFNKQQTNHESRNPNSSINFITCHDGFSLNDLVSFQHKHNEANGENNRDGNNSNWSNNFGVEGTIDTEGRTVSEEIVQKRLTMQKNLLTTLLLTQGTPMLLAGDEWGNSQQGNNNGYCQDNEITWLNWSSLTDKNSAKLLDYVKQLIAIRKQIPALNHNVWWQGEMLTADREHSQLHQIDVRWLNQYGAPIVASEWQDLTEPYLQIELSRQWLIVINASDTNQIFSLPDNCQKIILGEAKQLQTDPKNWQVEAQTISIFTLQE